MQEVSSGKVYFVCRFDELFLHEIYLKDADENIKKAILKYETTQVEFEKRFRIVNLYSFYNWQIKIFGYIYKDLHSMVENFLKFADYEDLSPRFINKVLSKLQEQSDFMNHILSGIKMEDNPNYNEFDSGYCCADCDGDYTDYCKSNFLNHLERSLSILKKINLIHNGVKQI